MAASVREFASGETVATRVLAAGGLVDGRSAEADDAVSVNGRGGAMPSETRFIRARGSVQA
jgi:hypothetical protein